MSHNPEQSISNQEINDSKITNNQKYKDSGYYKGVETQNVTVKDFENAIRLFFPFDRFYKPMWYNSENYNRVIVTAANSIGHSTTNLIKTDILENIKEWFRTIYLQSHLRDIVLPPQESIPSELRGRSVTIQQDTQLQTHLKRILAIIKGDGSYSVATPTYDANSGRTMGAARVPVR